MFQVYDKYNILNNIKSLLPKLYFLTDREILSLNYKNINLQI